MRLKASDSVHFVVVTIVLNDPVGLRRTISSISEQSTDDFAHVIVDGGSDDETLAIIGEAQETLGSEFLPGPDKGIYDAMNRALSGLRDDQWVLYLNAGDYFKDPDSAAFVIGALNRTCAEWCYGPIEIVELDGSLRGIPRSKPYTVHNYAFRHTRIGHQAVVANVGAMRAAGLFRLDMPNCADFDMMLKLGMRSHPDEWGRVFTVYEAGGGADQHGYEVTLAQARARRQLLEIKGWLWVYDNWRVTSRMFKIFVGNRVDELARKGLVTSNWRSRRKSHNREA